MRTVVIDGARVHLDPSGSNFIGRGGEAEVYRHNGMALKVFHPVDTSLPADEQRARATNLQLKGQKLAVFPKGLPAEVLSPVSLAHDPRSGHVVGYTMPLLSGMHTLFNLSDPDFRVSAKVGQADVLTLFKRFHRVLGGLHKQSVIVGDLNDGNELISVAPHDLRIIDVDSLQFSGYPCTVAAPRFLDPRLFGADLSKGLFSEETDWYAFACLFFQSTLCVLPYGGMHPKYRTYLRRAENRVCVLNKDVPYPGAGIRPDLFPDDLLHYFTKVFEKDLREVFPANLLEMRWTTCSKCGAEHGRPMCPMCSAPGIVVEATRVNRSCTATRVFTSKGAIRTLKVEQGRIKVVHEEGTSVYRENGKRVWVGAVPAHTRFTIQGNATWIGATNGTLLKIENEALASQDTTDTMGVLAVFDTTMAALYRIRDGYLRRNDSVVGSVIQGHTWLKTGEDFGFLASSAGSTWFFYLFQHDQPGFQSVQIPSPRGKVRDMECVFSSTHCLFLISEDRAGVIVNSMWLVSRAGAVVAQASGDADQVRMLRTIRGKCVVGDRVLCTTSEGLLQVAAKSGQLEETKVFSDTAPFVFDGAPIFPAPSGVWVADTKTVWLLALS